MLKTSIDPTRYALNGPTMGTRWQVLFHQPAGFDPTVVQMALQAAVAQVDAQMSTWRPDSDLMRLNAAPLGVWVDLPPQVITVLEAALQVGRRSGGAFDIAVGDAVAAWGFGPQSADPDAIRAALSTTRPAAQDWLEVDFAQARARKHAAMRLDLSGIAKGFGVDRLAEVAMAHGISAALVAIDGELRASGVQPDGKPWTVAIEHPDHAARRPHAMLALQDAAVATSGDYRHWVTVGDRRLSHTIDPARGGPLMTATASVTVVAATCMAADAWATALTVKGSDAGAVLARELGLNVLFLDREGDSLRETRVGPLFNSADDHVDRR